MVTLILDNVVPAKLSRGAFPALIQGLFALVAMLCLYLPARLLKGTGSLANTLRMSVLYTAYTTLAVVILLIATTVLFLHALGLSGDLLAWLLLILVQIPSAILALRGYFAGFSEFFELTKRRLLLASFGAYVISALSAALVFVPGIYLVVRFQDVFDLFF